MSDKIHLDVDEEEFHGDWPDDIRLQVMEAADGAETGGDGASPPDGGLWSSAAGRPGAAADTGPSWTPPSGAVWVAAHDDTQIVWLDDDDDEAELADNGFGGEEDRARDRLGAEDEDAEEEEQEKEEDGGAGTADVWPGGAGGDTADDSSSTGDGWIEFCRICHDGAERAPLVSACRCTGSMQHVHNECLIHWILSSFNTHCEICLHRYRIGTTGMRLPHRWKLPQTDGVERYHMMLCLVALVVLSAVISFLVYVSTDTGQEARTYRNSPLAPALYAVYAVLGLVCFGLATAELHYTVLPLLERFRLTNMNLLVVPYDPDEADSDTLDAFSADFVTV